MSKDYKSPQTIRDAAILTGSYVAATTLEDVHAYNQLILYVDFTIGSLTTAEIKVEFSADNTNFYHEAVEGSPSSGVAGVDPYVRQLSATGAFRLAIPIKDRYVKVSAKGTGTATSSSMTIKAVTGNV